MEVALVVGVRGEPEGGGAGNSLVETDEVCRWVRARNDGEQGKRYGVAQHSGPESSARVVFNILFSPLITVGMLVLLLQMLLVLMLYELELQVNNSLLTKNFIELRLNDVGTTVGERGLIPGKV